MHLSNFDNYLFLSRGEFVLLDYLTGAVVQIKMMYTRGKTQLIHIGSQK